MAEKLTQQKANKVISYLEEIRSDFENEDIDAAIEAVKDSVNSNINELNNTMITRMIQDDEIFNLIESCTEEKNIEENLFG